MELESCILSACPIATHSNGFYNIKNWRHVLQFSVDTVLADKEETWGTSTVQKVSTKGLTWKKIDG